jgi:CheY-like chemotaxis protein
VTFDDAVDGGTIFHVDLPVYDDPVATEIDVDSDSNAARILLCEGDRAAAVGLRKRLRRAGFAVDFANMETAAIARTGEAQYAAVLVGMKLPHGNGIGILQMRAQSKPADLEHLVQILSASIAPEPLRRPRILHVDDDRDAQGNLASVILYSAHSYTPRYGDPVHVAVSKSDDSLKDLVSAVRDRLAQLPEPITLEVA